MFSPSLDALRRARQRAFTLLEVMCAVLIIALLLVAVFRFVKTMLVSIKSSTEATVTQQQVVGLTSFLQLQLEDLPARQQGVLVGSTHTYRNTPSDEMEWLCPAGHGVLTTAASDLFRVTLALQNASDKSGELEIGLRRRPMDADERVYNWLPLLRPAAALEIRYFDPRQKAWIDAWKDPSFRPSLVRFRIWRVRDQPPYEAIIALPAARSQPS